MCPMDQSGDLLSPPGNSMPMPSECRAMNPKIDKHSHAHAHNAWYEMLPGSCAAHTMCAFYVSESRCKHNFLISFSMRRTSFNQLWQLWKFVHTHAIRPRRMPAFMSEWVKIEWRQCILARGAHAFSRKYVLIFRCLASGVQSNAKVMLQFACCFASEMAFH